MQARDYQSRVESARLGLVLATGGAAMQAAQERAGLVRQELAKHRRAMRDLLIEAKSEWLQSYAIGEIEKTEQLLSAVDGAGLGPRI